MSTGATLLPRDGKAGFTLMEMALALAIIGMVAALGLPFVRQHGGAALRERSSEIVGFMRAGRNAAIRSGQPVQIEIDPLNRTVRRNDSGKAIILPPSVTMAVEGGRRRLFEFFPSGASSGGAVVLTSPPRSYKIRINAITGAVDDVRL